MRIVRLLVALCLLSGSLAEAEEQSFRAELETRVAALEKKNSSVAVSAEGWLFLAGELRFLAQGPFWGEAAARTARSRKSPDPLPAILDFHRQLRARGIELLLVPVPAKAAVYSEKLGGSVRVSAAEAAPQVPLFYEQLRAQGIDVLDLASLLVQHKDDARGPVYCRTDSHWSGVGCTLAAQAIAERVKSKLPTSQLRKEYVTTWNDVAISGDLASLIGPDAPKPPMEKIAVRTVSEKANGASVLPDANSPLLVMGDSHTLVFHEFLAEHAGLVDQLADELGFAPDLIGTRGSGATAVRISLYRRTRSDPSYLAKKKIVVWCFAAREFTEADQGWVPQPVAQ